MTKPAFAKASASAKASADKTAGKPDAATAAVERLCAALEAVGDALVTVDADALLQGEIALAAAMSAIAAVDSASDRDAAVVACRRARVALLRCRRLGTSFSNLSRALSGPVSPDTYDRAGAYIDGRGASSALQARL